MSGSYVGSKQIMFPKLESHIWLKNVECEFFCLLLSTKFVVREEFAWHLPMKYYAGFMELSKKVSIIWPHVFYLALHKQTWNLAGTPFQIKYSSLYRTECFPFVHVILYVHFLVSDEDYILQFAPPFNRLELLQAQSCPDVITSHLDLLWTIGDFTVKLNNPIYEERGINSGFFPWSLISSWTLGILIPCVTAETS